MNYPQVSICSFFLNDRKMLKIVMDSVLKQTYPNIQHCITIGASTDGSLELVKAYEEKYTSVGKSLAWTDKPDKNIVEAYNNALDLVSETDGYYGFLTNPYINKDSLKTEMNFAISGGYDVVFVSVLFHNNKKILREMTPRGNPHLWKLGFMGSTEGLIINKNLKAEQGGISEFTKGHITAEDYDYNLRLIWNKSRNIACLVKPHIINYLVGGESNNNYLRTAKNMHFVLKHYNIRFAWITVFLRCMRVAFQYIFCNHKLVPQEMLNAFKGD